MTSPPLLLWATPRTLSTAFERMMIERGDHAVWDEPFSVPYYFGPDRRSARFALTEPDATVERVAHGILAHPGPLFVKDMAYQALPGPDDELLTGARHTFLIRDPARALVSYARKWPDITEEEAGYRAQRELFDRVTRLRGTEPVVIDGEDLRADPPAFVSAWCDRVGLDPRSDALQWEPGMQPQWERWRDWYAGVARSTGFVPPEDGPPPRASERRIADLVDRCRPHYEALAVHRLTAGVLS